MKLRAILLSLAVVLCLSAVAFAKGGDAGGQGHHPRARVAKAVAACSAERKADAAAFTVKYANAKGKRAPRRCVREHVKAARATCRAERKADPAAFKAKYANPKGKRAGRRCVRAHAGDAVR